jgi:hypothetical protein
MFFGRYNLYIQSMALLLNFKEKVELRFVELAAIAVYWSWFCALASYTESTAELVGYVVLSHGVSGILHVQITLSHFCMETFTKDQPVYTSDENDWFRYCRLQHVRLYHSPVISALCRAFPKC